jgi:hypothetical protein
MNINEATFVNHELKPPQDVTVSIVLAAERVVELHYSFKKSSTETIVTDEHNEVVLRTNLESFVEAVENKTQVITRKFYAASASSRSLSSTDSQIRVTAVFPLSEEHRSEEESSSKEEHDVESQS